MYSKTGHFFFLHRLKEFLMVTTFLQIQTVVLPAIKIHCNQIVVMYFLIQMNYLLIENYHSLLICKYLDCFKTQKNLNVFILKIYLCIKNSYDIQTHCFKYKCNNWIKIVRSSMLYFKLNHNMNLKNYIYSSLYICQYIVKNLSVWNVIKKCDDFYV